MTTAIERTTTTTPARRFGDWFDGDFLDLFRWFDERRPGLLPMADRIRVEEEAEGGVLHIRAEVPGIDPGKDAEITVTDSTLHIRVERRQEAKAEEEGRVRSEFRYGSFHRSLPLPKGVEAGQVQASYRDGILQVDIPLPAEPTSEARKVEVTRG